MNTNYSLIPTLSMFNKNWWFLNFQKEFLNFSFCIRKLGVAFYMINEIQPKIKFQNIVQCPSNFTYFLPHKFGFPGGRVAHPERPWLRHWGRGKLYTYKFIGCWIAYWCFSKSNYFPISPIYDIILFCIKILLFLIKSTFISNFLHRRIHIIKLQHL